MAAEPTPVQADNEEEYAALKPDFESAKLGCFLVVPLQYQRGKLRMQALGEELQPQPLTTPDLYDSVKQLMNRQAKGGMLRRYQLDEEALLRQLFPGRAQLPRVFYAHSEQEPAHTEAQRFQLGGIELYIFHTQVAFLCVRVVFDRMKVLENITNMGYANAGGAPDETLFFDYEDGAEHYTRFEFEKELVRLCSRAGLELFYDNEQSIFLEAYLYTTAVVPHRFRQLETMRQASFNLHLLTDLPTPAEDGSEEDINYVYAAKDQEKGSYRWGCCVTSQTLSYIVAREDLDLQSELDKQSENGLPLLLLMLYQRFTCLLYQDMLARQPRLRGRRIRKMKQLLLEFQAYGTIPPANISRWYNIKQIYRYLMQENDVQEAIAQMTDSLNLLAERQDDIADAKEKAVTGLIALFGLATIPPSVAELVDYLLFGGIANQLSILTSLGVISGFLLLTWLWHLCKK